MDVLDYLKVLRRRWLFIAAAVLAALAVGVLTLPPGQTGAAGRAGESVAGYKATTTLLQTSTSPGTVPLSTLPIFISTGDVPAAAARTLNFRGDPNLLGQQVTVTIDSDIGTIGVVASDPDAARAPGIADVFADELINYLRDRAQSDIDRKVTLLEKVLNRYRKQSDAIIGNDQAAADQRAGLTNAAGGVQQEITRLQVSRATAGFDLEVLQPATAVPVLSESGDSASTGPGNRWLRLALIVGMGLLLGAALALGIERFDTRLRGRKAVEDALRLPVVASVPPVSRRRRGRREVLAATSPQGATAEAYRSLRSAMALLPSRPVPVDEATTSDLAAIAAEPTMATVRDPRVLMIVSPESGDGKTTSLVNLASTLAETGRSVIVLDCDFRHPETHLYLGVAPGKGLSDLLATDSTPSLTSILQPTSLHRVQLALAGTSTQHPGALMGLMHRYVREARELADVVLIDTPPALLANDAIDLMPVADSVVVVVREGRTSTPDAQRLAALLARLRKPCLGVVLVGARDAGAAYFMRVEATRRRQLRRTKGAGTAEPTRSRRRSRRGN